MRSGGAGERSSRAFLVLDVLLDDLERGAAGGGGEVGRGPEVVAPEVASDVLGELLAQASRRDTLE